MKFISLLALFGFLAVPQAPPAVFTVVTTADGSRGSLRDAISRANATPGLDTVVFDIPTTDPGYNSTTGAWTITTRSQLTITEALVLDGYTQPGAQQNTNPVGQGLNTVLKIVLHFETPLANAGLSVAGNCTIRGLVFNGAVATDLLSLSDGTNQVEGNFFGTDAAGHEGTLNFANANASYAIETGTSSTTVGGLFPRQRNLFAGRTLIAVGNPKNCTIQGNLFGTTSAGDASQPLKMALLLGAGNQIGGTVAGAGNVFVSSAELFTIDCEADVPNTQGAGSNVIEGNFIGTDVTGENALGAAAGGIFLGSNFNRVGGSGFRQGNVISGNSIGGIRIGGQHNMVRGNRIGLQANADDSLGNGYGILVVGDFFHSASGNQIGGTNDDEGNVIAGNSGIGVVLPGPGTSGLFPGQAAILGNTIYDNGGLGIDLGDDGVTPNDPDPQVGPNSYQNYPELTSALFFNGKVKVNGSLQSAANGTYRVEFFADYAADSSGFGEGRFFLGSESVTTDANGAGTFSALLIYPRGTGVVSATATDANGNTSEFAHSIAIAQKPAQLLNVSSRALVQTGDNVLIAGMITLGIDQKKVIIRARGPSLPNAQVAHALADPTLELYNQAGVRVATNDNWEDSQRDEIIASGLAPTDPKEAALIANLQPNQSETAVVRGANGSTGVALLEVFDLAPTSNTQLVNLSSRGLVDTGENLLIGGFIVGQNEGNGRFLVRALGPSLQANHIANALGDPTLELRDQNGMLLASNDNWRDTQEQEISDTGLAPSDNVEAALITTLPPGSSTAVVQGRNGATGIALLEVYSLD